MVTLLYSSKLLHSDFIHIEYTRGSRSLHYSNKPDILIQPNRTAGGTNSPSRRYVYFYMQFYTDLYLIKRFLTDTQY